MREKEGGSERERKRGVVREKGSERERKREVVRVREMEGVR